MRTRVEKCSGGVTIIIPEEIATQAGLRSGESADLEVAAGGLLLRAARPETLADLLAGITLDNLHGEWAAGPPAGTELL